MKKKCTFVVFALVSFMMLSACSSKKLSGEYIFIIAGFSALLGLLLINFLPKTLQTIQR